MKKFFAISLALLCINFSSYASPSGIDWRNGPPLTEVLYKFDHLKANQVDWSNLAKSPDRKTIVLGRRVANVAQINGSHNSIGVNLDSSQDTGATSLRKRSDHFGDAINSADFGAVFNGTTDDGGGMNAAKSYANSDAIITVPQNAGAKMTIGTGWPASTPGKINWWFLGGVKQTGGGVPAPWGYDPLIEMLGNSLRLARGNNIPDGNGYMVRLDDFYETSGGNTGNTTGVFQPHCYVDNPKSGNSVWCQSTIMQSSSIYGENVASADDAIRPANILSDGLGPRGGLWGHLTQVNDLTGVNAQSSGSLVGHEIDIAASGKADQNGCATSGCAGRNGIQIVATTVSTAGKNNEITNGVSMASHNDNSYFDRGYAFYSKYKTAAFDTSESSPFYVIIPLTSAASAGDTVIHIPDTDRGIFVGMNIGGAGFSPGTKVTAITATDVTLSQPLAYAMLARTNVEFDADGDAYRLGAGQWIGYDATDAWRSGENSAGTTWVLRHSGSDVLSVDAAGNVLVAGNIRSSTGVALTNMSKAVILAISKPTEGMKLYDSDDHVEVTYRCPATSTCGWFPTQYGAAISK